MERYHLSLRSELGEYAAQADQLLTGWRAGEVWALDVFHHLHPRFLDERIPWLQKRLTSIGLRHEPASGINADMAA